MTSPAARTADVSPPTDGRGDTAWHGLSSEDACAQLGVDARLVAAIPTELDNDLELIGANGEQYDTTIVSGSNVCQPTSQVRLAAGDFRVGCTYFEVPKRTKRLSELQFTPDSGFASDTAQFHL